MASAVGAIRIVGLARLMSRLSGKSKAMDNALVGAVNAATALVDGTAKSIAPVSTEETNPGGNHGTLRGSIHPQPAERQGDKVVGGVGTSLEYAPYVEFGTGVRGSGSGYPKANELGLAYGGRPGQVAQPFLYPALHQNRKKINKIVRTAAIDAGRSR